MDKKSDIAFRRIGWQNTLEVIELSHKLLPRELCRKTHSLFALFVNLERRNFNLSFGLYSGNTMVGYMLVYFHDRSLYHQRPEKIVHIDEYCVAPQFRGRGREVLARMLYEIDIWEQAVGIEAIATGDALQHWLSIGRVVNRMGYETQMRENDCERGGHSMGRLRWDMREGETWWPRKVNKLPKADHFIDDNGHQLSVMNIRNRRQWLGLRSAQQALASAQNSTLLTQQFDYQWELWRHFGIAEQLNILTLWREDSLVAVLPLSLHIQANGARCAWLGEETPYPIAAPLYEPELDQVCHTLLATADCPAPASLDDSRQLGGLDQIEKNARYSQWFGLQRRNASLHTHFAAAVTAA